MSDFNIGAEPREQRLYQEAAELWRALHNQPPPQGCDAAALLAMALQAQPPETYSRLQSPHLRHVAGGRPPAG